MLKYSTQFLGSTNNTMTYLMDIINLLKDKESARKAFLAYHLVRRKYILTHACEHFNLNKMEPAPLLNHSLLDIGCGDTEMPAEMTFRGADVTAVNVLEKDTSSTKENAVKSGAIVNFEDGGIDKLVQNNRKFDIVLCMDLFEYIDHTSHFIEQIEKLLNDNGILIFSTNNRNASSFIWHILFAKYIFKWIPHNTYQFKRFRSPKKLTGKLKDKDFQLLDTCAVYLSPKHQRWKRCLGTAARYLGAATKKNINNS